MVIIKLQYANLVFDAHILQKNLPTSPFFSCALWESRGWSNCYRAPICLSAALAVLQRFDIQDATYHHWWACFQQPDIPVSLRRNLDIPPLLLLWHDSHAAWNSSLMVLLQPILLQHSPMLLLQQTRRRWRDRKMELADRDAAWCCYEDCSGVGGRSFLDYLYQILNRGIGVLC